MEICPHVIQDKTNSGACSFRAYCTWGEKQCLYLLPFNISINRVIKYTLECFPIIAIHENNDSIIQLGILS